MKILYLGPARTKIISFIESGGDSVLHWEDKLDGGEDIFAGVDLILSYGFQYILPAAVVDRFPRRIVNLHISLLPWNKGRDPNLWSFVEDTPKGVTIHYIDAGVDTGDIIVQEEVIFSLNETLRTSYQKLSDTIEALFCRHWEAIRNGSCQASPQLSGGSFHKGSDRKKIEHLLTEGWDTPVANLLGAKI